MTTSAQLPTSVLRNGLWAPAFAVALLCAQSVVLTQPARAQTFSVLHTFTGGADGATPYAGLTMDRRGSLYGTTYGGGNSNGSVYKLTHPNGGWTFAPLYQFALGSDGANPYAGVVIGPNGTLYGTTANGGAHDLGTVFNLSPPPHASPNIFAPWTESVLYSFQGGTNDGAIPYGSVSFDQAGDLYGTTTAGGGRNCGSGCGTVYELTPSASGWTERVIHSFTNTNGGGADPISGVILDAAGNLYGTTLQGGDFYKGAVYQLTYLAGSGWTENVLHGTFGDRDLSEPYGGLIFDQAGNLYGTAAIGDNGGGIFRLTPFDGGWTYSVLYQGGRGGTNCGPRDTLVMDAGGNLYGTTYCDGASGNGSVFKLAPLNGWTYTTLYSFSGGSDGQFPTSNVVIDANGTLYGTTTSGGADGYGTVWKITP